MQTNYGCSQHGVWVYIKLYLPEPHALLDDFCAIHIPAGTRNRHIQEYVLPAITFDLGHGKPSGTMPLKFIFSRAKISFLFFPFKRTITALGKEVERWRQREYNNVRKRWMRITGMGELVGGLGGGPEDGVDGGVGSSSGGCGYQFATFLFASAAVGLWAAEIKEDLDPHHSFLQGR